MKIKIITVGKTKESFWQSAEAEFAARIRRYCKLEAAAVKDASQEATRNPALVKKLEAERISAKIQPGDFVVALDKTGRQMASKEFAAFLQEKMVHSTDRVVFVVGGPLGLAADFVNRCDVTLSFSNMTLPHELAKVVLIEQIYRAFTIIRGEKYHK